MMNDRGVFIVLEGADGSGKGTQFKLLTERLRAAGYEVEVFDFPRYDKESSYFIRQYLNGRYGPASSINPYAASLFYALDRFEAAPDIRQALSGGKVVLSNRYVGSNMAHQGSKLGDPVEQRGFFVWEDSLEYNLLGIPRPNLNLFLRVPAEISYELIKQKTARNYTDKTHDEHEADIEHLKKSVQTYELLSKLFPKDFVTIESTDNGQLLPIPRISNLIWQTIQPILPLTPHHRGSNRVLKLDSLDKPSRPAASSTTAKTSPDKLLSLKIENVSLLAATTALLNSPEISLNWKLKESPTGFRFYKLPKTNQALSRQYNETAAEINRLYLQLKTHLKAANLDRGKVEAILAVLTPMAALVDVEISAKPQALKNLVKALEAERHHEFNWLANQIKLSLPEEPYADEQKAESQQKQSDFISLFMDGAISSRAQSDDEPIRLTSRWPSNEFDVIADTIYPRTDLTREEIIAEIESWPYERKMETLLNLISDGTNLNAQAVYKFDAVADMAELMPLFNALPSASISAQGPTARYGYPVPAEVEIAKVDDLYLDFFDKFLELFSIFQSLDTKNLIGYATAMGHKRRWLINLTLADLHILTGRESKKSLLVDMLIERIALSHPLIAQALLLKSRRSKSNSPKSRKNKTLKTSAKNG